MCRLISKNNVAREFPENYLARQNQELLYVLVYKGSYIYMTL